MRNRRPQTCKENSVIALMYITLHELCNVIWRPQANDVKETSPVCPQRIAFTRRQHKKGLGSLFVTIAAIEKGGKDVCF
jgi:hypothetical protein